MPNFMRNEINMRSRCSTCIQHLKLEEVNMKFLLTIYATLNILLCLIETKIEIYCISND